MEFDKRYGSGRISQSLVETYLKCGLRAQFQYVEGRRMVNAAMAIGTGLSKCAKADNDQKINHGDSLPLGDLQDVAVYAYDCEFECNEAAETKFEVEQGRDRTATAAVAYGERVSPIVRKVIAAEDTITINIDDELKYVGTPDYICEDGIGDLKTGRRWQQSRADASRQLTAYSLLHKSKYGEFPKRVWIDSLYSDRKGWGTTRLWSTRNAKDYRGFVYIVKQVVAAFNAGVFLPAPENGWWCSKKWCPYYKSCPAKGRKG